MNTKLFFPIVISIFIVACTEIHVDLKAEEAAIMKADSTWSALSAESKDVDKVVSYFANDAVVVPPGQQLIKGKEKLAQICRRVV